MTARKDFNAKKLYGFLGNKGKDFDGAASGIRTHDILNHNQAL